MRCLTIFEMTGAERTNDDPSNNILEILDMISISTRKHDMDIL